MSDIRGEYLGYFRTMLVIRKFEEALDELFGRSLVRGTCHLCVGQEASAVGACAGLRPTDQVSSTHRGHGHLIAKGGDPSRVMAELFGKADGYAQGRGGSQHMGCLEIGFLGSNGITGGGIPIATGAALASKRSGVGTVVLSFFGDGATAQGAFHEAANMGALWKLPVVYFCENNLYAMSTPIRAHSAVPDVVSRAPAYGITAVQVDGNDLLAVKRSVELAAERARSGEGPTLIESLTYRFLGHSRSDKRDYRTAEEEAEACRRDGIVRFRGYLVREGIATVDDALLAEDEARLVVEDAVRFATESPAPRGDPAAWVYAP